MSPRLEQLRAEVRTHAHNRPGTYRMLGPSGEVLYVGKSVHVRTRLLSYFRAERGEKAAEIIGHAHALKWDYAPSEFAASKAQSGGQDFPVAWERIAVASRS